MKARTLLRILSRAPRGRWPDGFIHHGFRALLLVFLALAAVAFFPVAPLPEVVIERGSVADEDVVAQFRFSVPKSESELAQERQNAAAIVTPEFVFDSSAVPEMVNAVDGFLNQVDTVMASEDSPETVERRLRDLLASYGIGSPSAGELALLQDPRQRQRFRQTIDAVIRDELVRGVARPADLEDAGSEFIRLRGTARNRQIPVDSVSTTEDFFNRAKTRVPPSAPAEFEDLQHLVLVRLVVPSIRPDLTATELARNRARAAVDSTAWEVLANERIVAKGDRINDEQIQELQAYRDAMEARGEGVRGGPRTAGAFLFNLFALSLLGVLLYFYRPLVYREARHVSLIAFLVLALVGAAAIIARYGAPVSLIPIAFPALVVATLWDGRLALNISLIMAVLLSGQPPFVGIVVLVSLVAGGAVASLTVRVVRRRAQIWQFIMLIAGGYALIAIVLGLLRAWPLPEIASMAGWGALNAIASAFAAMGFLPLFEGFTRITTDQTLLELADVNRPLLRRLSLEAPGTYAHSINVANLAEAGANAIGANALLTRVGVYYHDVGKIGQPHYFIENQPSGRNPHDKLKPATSASVVRNHVLDGLKLAEEEGLPDCVKAFIVEHHGTQAISFFYDQARESEPDGELDPKDFAYPGPRPQSRETAIVMLADSVESAARVLPDPSPDAIKELVDRIVGAKIDARQLDEAPLTLRELALIKAQFANVLTGMYHQRIDYPPTREERSRQTAGAATGT
jgi:putative nucleotidyltransferase with HDIG domain